MIYIDANNYLKRIYHGGGNPYGLFYNMLIKYIDVEVQLVCDTSTSRQYRKAIHPGYKAGRDQGDDPVYWEVYNNCKELANLFSKVKVINVTSGEADDYIVCRAEKGDTVISNDKDLWPLIDDFKQVNILLNASTKVDRALVEQKFFCAPKHIQLYKTLVGDPSDKIPGKRGFGPAAWAKINFEDRDYYTHFFAIRGVGWDEMFTESACMSWKLAAPYEEYEFEVVPDVIGNPLQFIEEKGIIL